MVWLTLTRTLKLLPHLWNRPGDIIYVPAFIAFGYYFAVMKLYALVTLHEVRQPDALRRVFVFSRSIRRVFFLRLDGELVLVLVVLPMRSMP